MPATSGEQKAKSYMRSHYGNQTKTDREDGQDSGGLTYKGLYMSMIDRFKEDFKLLGVREGEQLAEDREAWISVVEAPMGLRGLDYVKRIK